MLINKLGLIIFIFLTLFNNVLTQLDCDKAPDEQTKSVCNSMVEVMKNASEFQDNNPLFKPGFQPDSAPDRPELKCLNLSCYCEYLGGKSNGLINDCTLPNGQKLKKAIRKELRMLTDEERIDIFKAIRAMKDDVDYDYIAAIHRLAYESGGAHGGPAFFVWHLEYMKRFEILLRKRNPTIALPYWDSTLDSRLSTPADSILFTDDFLGKTDSHGNVVTGPFSPWQTLEGDNYIQREVGKGGGCMTESDVQWTLSQTKIENVLACTVPGKNCPSDVQWNAFEFPHGKVHNFIGKDMQITFPNKAANDFVFFLHHSFVNLIFETWRQSKQTRLQRVNDYPADIPECEPAAHFRNATMSQFAPLKNIDGLRNEYTDNMYEYAPRPTCTATTECGSKYLFCDRSHDSPHCASKVIIGGNCKGFTNGEDACMNSICVNDVCVVRTKTTTQPTKESITIKTTKAVVKNTTKRQEITPITILINIKTTKKANFSTTKTLNIASTYTPKASLTSTLKTSVKTNSIATGVITSTSKTSIKTNEKLTTTKILSETTKEIAGVTKEFPEETTTEETQKETTTEIPKETTLEIPKETTIEIPEETTKISEEITTELPEKTTKIPEETTEIPKETTIEIPEETTKILEEITTEHPEETTTLTRKTSTKQTKFVTTKKQVKTTKHTKTKKPKKHHKKHSKHPKHAKTFMTTINAKTTVKIFFPTKQTKQQVNCTTVKPTIKIIKGRKCKCIKKRYTLKY